MRFSTKLWKRSNKSFATTIPHIALLNIDESKEYDVEWEFDQSLQKWTISLKQSLKQKDAGASSDSSVQIDGRGKP